MPSVQEQLRAKRLEKLAEPIRLPIPGWADDCLVGVYRPVDEWSDVREFLATSDPRKELEVAAQTLVSHCTAVEGHTDDGQTHQLPKLGKALADELGATGAESDEEAVFLLIPTQSQIMEHYVLLRQRSGAVVLRAEEEMQGESQAS